MVIVILFLVYFIRLKSRLRCQKLLDPLIAVLTVIINEHCYSCNSCHSCRHKT